VVGLLKGTIPDDRVEDVAGILSQGTWTHDYPIDANQARGFGLPVSTDMPRQVYELMELYPQPRGNKPSVQYIPMPHQREVNGKGH
jgi:ClpP class serine protease